MSKVCDSSTTRRLLKWEPMHSSFRNYMRRKGGNEVVDIIDFDNHQK